MSKYELKDIARYTVGDMDAIERAEFEYELMLDPALQLELENYRHVHSSLQMKLSKSAEDLAFKHSIKEEAKVHFSEEGKVVALWKYARWASAIAAILIIAFIWAPWREDLYSKYSRIRMVAMAERGESPDQKMTNAVNAFNNRDFSTAGAILKEIYIEEPENSVALYYFGISSLQADELIAARDAFDKVYQGSSIFKYDAAFYMALSYLKENDKERCREWLRKVPADASCYAKASDLLRELN